MLLITTSVGQAKISESRNNNSSDIKISILQDQQNPRTSQVEFYISGETAVKLWDFLDKAESAGGNITGDAAMGTSSLEAPNIACFHNNPDPYYHGSDEGYLAYRKAHEKDPKLYKCNIRLDWQGLASGHYY